MRSAGIREVRQNLSALLREVRMGREIVLTDRGESVARRTPPSEGTVQTFPDLADFRRGVPRLVPLLSSAVVAEREDRL